MNENTQRSSPILMSAIMKGTTEAKRNSACSLVLAALEDRDKEINKVWDAYGKIKNKYNSLIEQLEGIKNREPIGDFMNS